MAVHLLAALGLGNYPLVPDKYPHSDVAPLPTVAVRKCSSTKLLEFANEDKRVREDVLIDILATHFAPPAGQAPDLLFMPTSCGWADPALHDAKALGPQRVMLAAGPSKCAAIPGQTAANDAWCAGSCHASPAVCPEELCECSATQTFEVTDGDAPTPRLGHFAMVASPWGAFPQAKPLMRPLLEQQWPKKMAILSTEVPAFAGSWDGNAAEPTLRQTWVWGQNHPQAAGMAVPFLSPDLPATVPGLADRPSLAAFVGTVFINAKHGKTVGRSPLRELLVNECKWPANKDACELVTDIDDGDKTTSMSRHQVYGKNSEHAMDRVTQLAKKAYQRATFAFCPWGDVLSRKSTFDALMQGSIPVFFEGVMAEQYAHFGPIKNISVQVPLSVLKHGGGGALKYLRKIPASKVKWLHLNVARLRRQFHMPDSVDGYKQGDAVDNIVRKLAAHFRSVDHNERLAASRGGGRNQPDDGRTLPDIPLHPKYARAAARQEAKDAKDAKEAKAKSHTGPKAVHETAASTAAPVPKTPTSTLTNFPAASPVVRLQRRAGLLHSAKLRNAHADGGLSDHFKAAEGVTVGGTAEPLGNRTIGLYRIIGNALPPRHDKDQLLRSLTFMLENEPTLPGAIKLYLLNRLHNSTELKMAKELITRYGHKWIEDPLVPSNYRKFQQDSTYGLPSPTGPRYGTWGRIMSRAGNVHRLESNLFLMNNNGARNLAIADGMARGFDWVLPFDGNSFFTIPRWEKLRAGLRTAALQGSTYLTLPLVRTVSVSPGDVGATSGDLWRLPDVAEPGEPQVAFQRKSVLRFNPTIPYGHRPKVELLWRLGVPGEWDNYQSAPYEVSHACEHGAACSRGVEADPEESRRCLVLDGVDDGVLRLPDIAEETAEARELAGELAGSASAEVVVLDSKRRGRPVDPTLVSGEGKKARHARGEMRDEGVKFYIDRFDLETHQTNRRGKPDKPLFSNLAAMEHTRRSWLVGVRSRATAQVDNLMKLADESFELPLPSLTDKKAKLHADASLRHYQSVALFDWQVKELTPEQRKAALASHGWTEADHPLAPQDWITWSGHERPGGEEGAGDRSRAEHFHSNLTMFSLASFYSNDFRYSERAVQLVRKWWLNDDTGMLPTLKYAQANRPEDERYPGVIEMRSIATALDAVALLKGTASWLPDDETKMRTWCQKYGEWLKNTPERNTDNSHRWWWGVQQVAVLQCAGEKLVNPLVATAKLATDAIDSKTGIMALERHATGRDVHAHIFAAHAIMLVWRACENYGLIDIADSLKVKLTSTFKLLSESAGALKDSDHFTEAQLTTRLSQLCQWSDDANAWVSNMTMLSCTPKMLPEDYMHSGAIPFSHLIF